MNINMLEKLARKALKGSKVNHMSALTLNKGLISPMEHRYLNSLSWQITANVKGSGAPATTLAFEKYILWC